VKLKEELSKINWLNFNTAYGKADLVPKYLYNLFSSDKEISITAINDLWNSLCHQYAFISNAALPSYDFLIEGLLILEDDIKIEILDILKGFSILTSNNYYKQNNLQPEKWESELKNKLINDLELFHHIEKSSNNFISEFASEIIINIGGHE
jgi:hypothetical protein